MIEHVKKLARAGSDQARKEIFVALGEKLEELFKDPNESLVLKYFDVLAWVRSRSQDKTFSQVVKEALPKKSARSK